jgi:CheY-like chemotaxis protein
MSQAKLRGLTILPEFPSKCCSLLLTVGERIVPALERRDVRGLKHREFLNLVNIGQPCAPALRQSRTLPLSIVLEVAPMKHHILVVDDEKSVRESQALLLRASGYEVSTAENGLDALLQLKTPNLPDLVISDLNMPHMSGFELLSVLRRRFPQISVIASSGAYLTGAAVPGGVIADAFHSKNGSGPAVLLKTVARLLETSAQRNSEHQGQSAPVWIPRNGKDSNGVPFIVVTCTNCLRSFPLSVLHEDLQEVQEAACLFCPETVRYVVDFSRDVNSPKPPKNASAAAATSRAAV